MPLHKQLPDDIRDVDVIVAGGGSAGCVLASRLAEADPNLQILLIEQGMDNHNVPEVVHPALFEKNILPGSKTALFWQSNKAKELANRAPVIPSGGILGGGSSINWMVYTRAQRADFDSWKMAGWSADELLPFLKKFENYHGRGEKAHHGYSGPIHISSGTYRGSRAENDFIQAAAKMGYPEMKDLQDLDSNNGVERWYRYVSPQGKRQDSAHTFLHPKLQSRMYHNLHVLVEHQVVRALIDEDEKRAVGVEFQPNPMFQEEGRMDEGKRTVGARKMVVLSAGACGTPLILERSGIGDEAVLGRAGVPVIEHLPGVGNDYQDHHLVISPYRTCLTNRETINGIAHGKRDVEAMVKSNDNLLGWNSMDASGKFRPKDRDVEALGPEFKEAWDRDFKPEPNRPLMITALYSCYFGDPSTLPDDAEYISMVNWTAYPYSRGHIHITGPEMSDRIDFNVGYLTDENDIDLMKHVWAYKNAREMFRRMSIYRGELAQDHPQFPRGSKAACIEKADGPVDDDAPPIKYTKEDDAAIEQFVRERVGTTWHSLGTCKMAPRDEGTGKGKGMGGVVDETLSVYGVKGLKCADLSIPPKNVGANTNNTALMIGEKAADIIIKELGLAEK